jgi:hypothetical protein
MKKIYAYYESIALSNQPEEFACANHWKASWEQNGWEPVMLNRSHAQGSHLYNKLQQRMMNSVMGLPAELSTRFHWITARFSRWCALHAAGGGWMCDYDVFNKSFKPETADKSEGKDTLVIVGDPAFLFYATKEHAAAAITKLSRADIIENNSLASEHKLLGVELTTKGLAKQVVHAKPQDETTRSEIMGNLMKK